MQAGNGDRPPGGVTVQFSVLTTDLFRVILADGSSTTLTLPGLLAALSAEGPRAVIAFPDLRPHQHPGWHAFLVQIGYQALDVSPDPTLPSTEADWLSSLRRLTAAWPDDSPWHLLQDDWQQPAFLQSPCPVERQGDYKREALAAQDIDVLVTARHHDEKNGKLPLDEARLAGLVHALVMLQGWSGFLGAGNYGSMRMNGGFGSRSQFRLAFDRGAGSEFRRDLGVLLARRDRLQDDMMASQIGHRSAEPIRLAWLVPWTDASLALADVHPYCLEVCRRVRLVRRSGQLALLRATSKGMRIDGSERLGRVLDPWSPIVLRGSGASAAQEMSKALTALPSSLGYRALQRLLFDRTSTELPVLAKLSSGEARTHHGRSAALIAQVLVGGQGKTDGLLRREILLTPTVVRRHASEDAALGRRAEQFVQLVSGVPHGQKGVMNAFRSALIQFVDGSDDVDWKNPEFVRIIEPSLQAFDAVIDEAFFPQLFRTFEDGLEDTPAQQHWAGWLKGAAVRQLNIVIETLPTRDSGRHLAAGRARSRLDRELDKSFGALLAARPAPAPRENAA